MRARRRSRVRLVVAPVLLALLVGCGGGEGGGAGEVSPTRTPTADRPTADRPTADRTDADRPGPEEPDETPDEPTPEEPTPEEPTPDRPDPTRDRTDRPDATPSDEVTEAQEPSPTSAPEETATTTTTSAPTDEDESVPAWVWWLLAALLGLAVAVPLLVRARRRAAWRRELAEAEAEIAWFARVLLQELRRAGSLEEATGGWTVGQPRVVAAEDRLAVLESSAPDEEGRARSRELLDASRLARAELQRITGPGPHETWALDLDAVVSDLELALAGGTGTLPAE